MTAKPLLDVLEEMEAAGTVKPVEHGLDKGRSFQDCWECCMSQDWDITGKGQWCDAVREVRVGTGEYDGREDPKSRQYLLVKVRNTEVNVDGPVFGVALTVAEVLAIEKEIAKGNASTVIYKEPRGPKAKKASWFTEVSWILEDSSIAGIQVSLKASQDKDPQVTSISFFPDPESKQFDYDTTAKPQVVPVKNPVIEESQLAALMPPPQYRGDREPSPLLLVGGKSRDVSLIEATGDSQLSIRWAATKGAQGGRGARMNGGSMNGPWTMQVIASPKLLVTNQSEQQVSVTAFCMEVWDGEEKAWKEFAEGTQVGYADNWRGGSRMIPELSSFEAGANETTEVCFEGRQRMPVRMYGSHELTSRIHGAFLERVHAAASQAVTCRISLTDSAKLTKQIEFDVANDAVDPGFSTYPDAVSRLAQAKEERDGIDSDHNCHLFLATEKPDTLTRLYVIVTSKKVDPEYWVITASNGRRNIERATRYLYPEALKKVAYLYSKGSIPEERISQPPGKATCVQVHLPDFSCEHCDLYALIDPNNAETVFGIRGEILVKADPDEQVTVQASDSFVLDYSTFVQ